MKMAMYEFLVKRVFTTVVDFHRGANTMKRLDELEDTQWWPREKILVTQDERLRKLISYAYDNVPYYRNVFDQRALKPEDIVTSGDLAKLPILTRQLVRSNFNDLVARGFPKKELMPCLTGGSTGEALRFYRTRDDYHGWEAAAGLRAHKWAGYEVGEKLALFWGRHPRLSIADSLTRTARHFVQRVELFDALTMSEKKMPAFAKRLEGFDGGFIKGYPSAIYLMARYIEREGKHTIRPRAIITTGEALYDFRRELFSKVFGCETYSFYATNEVDAIASECSEHSGYHISAENVIVEILDDADKLVPVGKEGRILVTSLHNYGMPFIRYEIGDVGVISDKACPCGRGLPLLAEINGRVSDFIFTRGGDCIPGIALNRSFLAGLGVEQFQIVQESYEKVVIKLVFGGEYKCDRVNEAVKKIERHFKSELGGDIDIVTELVDQIVPTRIGKRRMFISKVTEVLP
jgi:phenylacetate-CoA ligase